MIDVELDSSDFYCRWDYFIYNYLDIRLGILLVWFTFGWWGYLLKETNLPDDEGFLFWRKIKSANCRRKGHPYGVVWNSSGDEPDMHCNNCCDDLG